MTAIRNRNTSVPHVFRYPRWQEGVFYPAGSLVSYPVAAPSDSDQAYWDFYVAKVDVVISDIAPPPSNSLKYKLIMSTSTVGDSEVNQFLLQLDSEIKAVSRRVDRLVDRDSDFLIFLDSEISERIQNDSDIQFIKNALLNRDNEIDSDLQLIRHDFAAADSDKLSGVTTDLHDLKAFDSDVLLMLDSDFAYLRTHQQIYAKVTGGITKGELAMFAGVQGDHILVKRAVIDSDFKDYFLVGVAPHTFANNAFGYFTTSGIIDNINTNGWNEGDVLYANPLVSGGLTNVKPIAPKRAIVVAAVHRKNTNNGKLQVRLTFSRGLDELRDVRVTSLTDGQILVWDAVNKYWKNTTLSSALGNGFDYGTYF